VAEGRQVRLKVLSFDLRGDIAHFRRPDTTVTHATYPFITRTVLAGLCASIIGRDSLDGDNYTGIQLFSRIRTVAQEMSMLGKGWLGSSQGTFNRPTSVELVVAPHYRIYYIGTHIDELFQMILSGSSVYHTYLGSAYCLTFPYNAKIRELEVIEPAPGAILESATVVPSHAIRELVFADGAEYGRVGGMQYKRIEDRDFEGTINVIYDSNAGPVVFRCAGSPKPDDKPYIFVALDEAAIATLW
jgi:CRISPR-associated protein Cas5h